MSRTTPLLRRASIAGLAVAGLTAGHCLILRMFADAGPHAHHQASSHSHGPYLVTLVAALLVAAVGAFVDHRIGKRKMGAVATTLLLTGAQSLGYTGLTVIEAMRGEGALSLGGRVFFIGVVMQALVAAVGALVLILLRRTAAAIDRVFYRRPPMRRAALLPSFSLALFASPPSLAMAAGGPSFRGPPLSA